jgi:hypothetical protein
MATAETRLSPEPSTDAIGIRPPGEDRRGVLDLLRLTYVLILVDFWQLLRLALCCTVVAATLVYAPIILLMHLIPDNQEAVKDTGFLVSWLLLPLVIGYEYSVLLTANKVDAKAKTLFYPFSSFRLYLSVLLAGSISYLGAIAVSWIAGHLSLAALETHFHPFFADSLRYIVSVGLGLLLAPLAFAGLDAAVRRGGPIRALGRCIDLARRQLPFFLACALLMLALNLIFSALDTTSKFPAEGLGPDRMILDIFPRTFLALMSAFVSVASFIIQTIVLVLIYRELVWRDREAAEPHAA